jgi:hypothetical protein
LENFSSRVTLDSVGATWADTIPVDSTVNPDSVIIVEHEDTVSYRSRKKFGRIDHSASANFPLTIAKYVNFNPSFSYSENWIKIHETDQSLAKRIDASTTYRTYTYSAGTSLSTKLYGTLYPKVFGLEGLRQVITPEISYRFTPKSDRHPVVSSYAGASARSISRSQEMSFTLSHLYQAKLRLGDKEHNLELLSVNHSFSYDFEEEKRKVSNMSTTLRSNLLKNIRLNAGMNHSFYNSPTSDEFDILKPHLTSFNLDAAVSLRGKRFLFDEAAASLPAIGDTTALRPLDMAGRSTSAKGWDMSATYSYSENGKFSGIFRKTSSLRLSLNFNLTANTQIGYSQYYDIATQKTISNRVSIVKTLHCWTGTFHWVPTGSTRGWGFMLYVTAMPEIKIDNSQNAVGGAYLQGF